MTDTQLQKPQHPAFLAVAEQRSAKVQLRVADTITAFAGSMRFVLPAWHCLRRLDARVREESLADTDTHRLA